MSVRSAALTTTAGLAAAAAILVPTTATASPNTPCGSVRTAQGRLPVTTFGAGANCRTARKIIKAVVTKDGYRRTYKVWTCETFEKTLSCGASGARNAGSTLRRTTPR